VVTALSAWLFAGETPGPREWAGGVCIVLASALSSWVHRSKVLPPDPSTEDVSVADEPAPGSNGGAGNGDGTGGNGRNDRKGGKNRPRAMV
jgi:hypothetical protein